MSSGWGHRGLFERWHDHWSFSRVSRWDGPPDVRWKCRDSFADEVRPCLELEQRTLLTYRVATVMSWSPLSGLKGVKPPVEF